MARKLESLWGLYWGFASLQQQPTSKAQNPLILPFTRLPPPKVLVKQKDWISNVWPVWQIITYCVTGNAAGILFVVVQGSMILTYNVLLRSNISKLKKVALKFWFASDLSCSRLELTFPLACQSSGLSNKISSGHPGNWITFQFQASKVVTW